MLFSQEQDRGGLRQSPRQRHRTAPALHASRLAVGSLYRFEPVRSSWPSGDASPPGPGGYSCPVALGVSMDGRGSTAPQAGAAYRLPGSASRSFPPTTATPSGSARRSLKRFLWFVVFNYALGSSVFSSGRIPLEPMRLGGLGRAAGVAGIGFLLQGASAPSNFPTYRRGLSIRLRFFEARCLIRTGFLFCGPDHADQTPQPRHTIHTEGGIHKRTRGVQRPAP